MYFLLSKFFNVTQLFWESGVLAYKDKARAIKMNTSGVDRLRFYDLDAENGIELTTFDLRQSADNRGESLFVHTRNRGSSMKKSYLLTQFVAILVVLIFFACQKEMPSLDAPLEQRIKQHGQDDLNSFLLNKIIRNKIVMLGDHEHGQGLYSRIVTEFLYSWLNKIEQDQSQQLPRRLTLFLEHDSLTNQRLYQFFYSGNLMDFIEPEDFVVSFTVDKVEFIYDLSDIYYYIKELNDTSPLKNKIHFQIIGPEKIPDVKEDSLENPVVLAVGERDKYSADQICRYLETHPNSRAFIFYGAAHLFRKGMPTSHPGRSSYMLAHYLTDEYQNRGGCYTIFQYNLRANTSLPQILSKPGRNYALENQYLKDLKFDLPRFPYDADASFFLNDFYYRAAHLGQVPTNNFINLFLECLPIYLKNPDRPGNDLVIRVAVQYLQMVSGFPTHKIDFENMDVLQHYVNEWKMWYLQNGFDPITWTNSYQFLLKPFRIYRQTPDQQNRLEIELALKKLLGTAPDTLVSEPDEQVYVWLRHIDRNRIPVLVPRFIQIMWVGTEDEQRRAGTELTKLTRQNFRTAKEWAIWWRKKVELVRKLQKGN